MTVWGEMPSFSGKHVTLRPLDRSDRRPLLEAFKGLEGLFHTTVPDELTIDGWFDQLEREQAAGRAAPFTLLDAEGRVSATTRFLRMNPRHRRGRDWQHALCATRSAHGSQLPPLRERENDAALLSRSLSMKRRRKRDGRTSRRTQPA